MSRGTRNKKPVKKNKNNKKSVAPKSHQKNEMCDLSTSQPDNIIVTQSQPNKSTVTQPEPQPQPDKYKDAFDEFVLWWRLKGDLADDDGYIEQVNKLGEVTKDLPSKPLTLFHQTYRFGFPFFYGFFKEEDRYIPISYQQGVLIKYQKKHEQKPVCPILDPKTNEYFVPDVEVEILPPPTGSTPTDQHLQDMYKYRYHNRKYYNILKVLTPYAKQIKECDENLFEKLVVFKSGFAQFETQEERERRILKFGTMSWDDFRRII